MDHKFKPIHHQCKLSSAVPCKAQIKLRHLICSADYLACSKVQSLTVLHMTPKFAHLAIGTEVTMGQILNSNSRWLSQKLGDIGFECFFHLAMPDETSLVQESLEFLKNKVDLIIVTGGLGPTSDDLTRELIAQFSGCPLEWSNLAWDHLVNYLNLRQVDIREAHKKEALVPRGAKLLINPSGTACGFAIEQTPLLPMIVALPGPPREIAAIWDLNLKSILQQTYPERDFFVTVKWDVLGLAESAVAEKLKDIEDSPLLVCAYRIHLPYVEFKVRFLKSNESIVQHLIDKTQRILKDFVHTQNGQDIIEYFFETINLSQPLLTIFNPTHNLILAKRLLEFKSRYEFLYSEIDSRDLIAPLTKPYLIFEFDDSFEFLNLKFNISNFKHHQLEVNHHMSSSHSIERKTKMLIEKAFVALSAQLNI